MDLVKLRTLTLKSKLGFGKYSDLTISEIIDLNHQQYLRYCYYKFESINFTIDILETIGVIKAGHDNRIEKPGTNEPLFRELNEKFISSSYKNNGRIQTDRSLRVGAKIKLKTSIERDKIRYSKQSLQSRNHGH
jgi:hypothetical protein